MKTIARLAGDHDKQALITTHNPAILVAPAGAMPGSPGTGGRSLSCACRAMDARWQAPCFAGAGRDERLAMGRSVPEQREDRRHVVSTIHD
jgi:hypothetical protein